MVLADWEIKHVIWALRVILQVLILPTVPVQDHKQPDISFDTAAAHIHSFILVLFHYCHTNSIPN